MSGFFQLLPLRWNTDFVCLQQQPLTHRDSHCIWSSFLFCFCFLQCAKRFTGFDLEKGDVISNGFFFPASVFLSPSLPLWLSPQYSEEQGAVTCDWTERHPGDDVLWWTVTTLGAQPTHPKKRYQWGLCVDVQKDKRLLYFSIDSLCRWILYQILFSRYRDIKWETNVHL